jgi:hypothetical protein
MHVVNAGRLASTTMPAVIERDAHDFRCLEAVARDPEWLRQPQRFDRDV